MLIAYSPAKNETKQVKLGGDYHWRSNGTFWVDYEDVLKPMDVQFPAAGTLSFRLPGVENIQTITF
ncbi:MAG: hypothetical protein LLF76_08725 [Planctomycetaceae bacterium]|nr:hypothetical protein [Planctomycetaceae bacterium]